MAITCGIDWAEKHHDVTLVGDDGRVIVHRRITTDAAGFTALIALLIEHAGDPASVPVAIETDKNLVVVGLQAVGVTVYPINPRACARYRERHSQSGGKSDPGDAFVLASILRTDQHMHRALPQLSDNSKGLKALARQHQEAIWAMHQTQSRLRSVLLEFYPQALDAFPNLNHKAAHKFLAALPSPASAQKLTLARMVTLLRRSGRGNRAGLAEKIRAALTAPGIRQPAPVEDALAVTVQGLVAIIVMMQASVEALGLALGKAFATLPAARIAEDIPGLGVVLEARVLAEIGDDLTRFVTA
jgi:transposase